MPEHERDLDLLADHVVRRMHVLCGGALRENLGLPEVLEVLGVSKDGSVYLDDPLDLKRLHYADDILYNVIEHIQSKWAAFRQTETSPPTFDDDGEFEA